jgi:hypothetical protein
VRRGNYLAEHPPQNSFTITANGSTKRQGKKEEERKKERKKERERK